MRNSFRAIVCIPCSLIKFGYNKLLHQRNLNVKFINIISPFTEITIEKGSKISLGYRLTMRGGAKLRVRENARLTIGDNTYINHNCMIVCRENIEIGNNVQFSPNVLIYDHDHDFRVGLQMQKFKTSPIKIGNNVWIGANSIILRGSEIGDNVVIAAGSIVKNKISAGTVFIQKRNT